MLPKANRLKRPQEFNRVYRRGIRRSSPHLSLIALRITGSAELTKASPDTRIGISISLKVSKHSVVRNRIKRQIRGALRQMLPRLNPGWDLAIVVRPAAQKCKYAQFLQELEQLLVEVEVLDGNSRRSIL